MADHFTFFLQENKAQVLEQNNPPKFMGKVHQKFSTPSPVYRASDNSREKNSNFAGFVETNSRRKRPILREFRVNFGSKFRRKAKKKEPRKKIYFTMSNSGQERKHKSSFNTVLKATVLVSSDKKNISLSFTETPGRLTSFFSCSLEPNKATQ